MAKFEESKRGADQGWLDGHQSSLRAQLWEEFVNFCGRYLCSCVISPSVYTSHSPGVALRSAGDLKMLKIL